MVGLVGRALRGAYDSAGLSPATPARIARILPPHIAGFTNVVANLN